MRPLKPEHETYVLSIHHLVTGCEKPGMTNGVHRIHGSTAPIPQRKEFYPLKKTSQKRKKALTHHKVVVLAVAYPSYLNLQCPGARKLLGLPVAI